MTRARKATPPPVSFLVLQHEIGAAEFKARCLEIMDEIQRTGAEVVITKHRKPVARLVPIAAAHQGGFVGSMKGMITYIGDIVSPVDDEEWTGDESNLT